MNSFFPLRSTITELISIGLSKIGCDSPDKDLIKASLSVPPNKKLGQLCFGGFRFTKQLGKNPALIATELQEILGETPEFSLNVAGPYLNFDFSSKFMGDQIISRILDHSFFEGPLKEDTEKIMVEYSQPNTHKELHVGHMRNLCLGQALTKILRYSGDTVHDVTFPGDVGTHVAKCLWYLKKYNDEAAPEHGKGAWLGKMYSKAHLLLEDEKGSDKENSNREELTKILSELHGEKGEYYDLWKETRQWSVEQMEDVYNWARVKFDRWFWESEVDAPSVKIINEYFEKGLFVKDDGAVGIDLSEEKLGFCLLLKSDGNGLYSTKDVALAIKKFEEFNIDKNIYIVDKRQAHHFKQVFATLKRMGFEKSKDCYHLQYDFVELPDGAMSSRKGNIVPLMSLISQMQDHITESYLEKYRGDWSHDDIESTSKVIAEGAIKFGMNRIDPAKKIVFDMNEWLKLDGENGPYIQYVHARIMSMLGKIEKSKTKANYSLLKTKSEKNLLFLLSEFNKVALDSSSSHKTSLLCNYLYDLAKAFNSFYAECSVAKAENNEIKAARYDLSLATQRSIKEGLALIGIQAPKRM